MDETLFSSADLRQIEQRGISLEEVTAQIEIFGKGFSHARLNRPCTAGDGILVLDEAEEARLEAVFSRALAEGRTMKFVPASGAATRMLKSLISFRNRLGDLKEGAPVPESVKDDPDFGVFKAFVEGIGHFGFFEDLKTVLSRDGHELEDLVSKGQGKILLDYALTPAGLGLADLPKGLIKFHRYPDHTRTPFEEHLIEAAAYGSTRIHFTVSPGHEAAIREHIQEVHSRYEGPGVSFQWDLSAQKASTDTIAVDMDNRPFRDREGGLVFRPGGHGALLANLGDVRGDVVFIKNIDNVVPDRLKQETYRYKRALGGCLVDLQDRIFGYLQALSGETLTDRILDEIFGFAEEKLSMTPPEGIGYRPRDEKIRFLFSRLNRPLRVCGMVRNQGEPGGGPFWVEHGDGTESLQIVESSQVDMTSPEQRAAWQSSTHFNPVDLVCGIRDHRGRPFELTRFRDPETGFISVKSSEGRELKALELPGLWNGAMAFWNTVFVEVPIITFNPVKTVLDLLRAEHRPG